MITETISDRKRGDEETTSKICGNEVTFLRARVQVGKYLDRINGTWTKCLREVQPKHFDVTSAPVGNLDDLSKAFRTASKDPQTFLIHGRLREGLPTKGTRRKADLFEDPGRHFVVLDVDAIGGLSLDAATAAAEVRSKLPSEFHGARCLWNATAGHTIPGKDGTVRARLRLVFWCSRSVSLAETDAWLSACGVPLDRSIWSLVQPIYLAVETRGVDPVAERWGKLDGSEAVEVPSELHATAKARETRAMTVPEGVKVDDPVEIEKAVQVLESRMADRVMGQRRVTFMAVANDCFDRAVSENATLAMIQAWFFHDDESERDLADVLTEAGCPDAVALGRRVRRAGQFVDDGDGFAGEPLDFADIARMVGDAGRSRSTPIGSKSGTPSPVDRKGGLGAVEDTDPDVRGYDDAVALVRVVSAEAEAAFDILSSAMSDFALYMSDSSDALGVMFDAIKQEAAPEFHAQGFALALRASQGDVVALMELRAAWQPMPAKSKSKKSLSDYLESFDDSTTGQVVEPTWIIENLIELGSIFMVYGRSGGGKSAIVLDLLLRIAAGLPWAGRQTQQRGVLYVCPEGTPGIRRRMKAWRQRHGIKGRLPFDSLLLPVDLFRGTQHADELLDAVNLFKSRHGIDCAVVMIDTLRQSMPGGDENSAKDIGTLVANAQRVRVPTGCAIGFVHHVGKDKDRGASGSTAIPGNLDIELYVDSKKGESIGQIVGTKLRDGVLSKPLKFRLTTEVLKTLPDGKVVDAVVAEVDDPTASVSSDGSEYKDGVDDQGEIALGALPQPLMPNSREGRQATMEAAAELLQAQGATFTGDQLADGFNTLRRAGKQEVLGRTQCGNTRRALIEAGVLIQEGEHNAIVYRLTSLAERISESSPD